MMAAFIRKNSINLINRYINKTLKPHNDLKQFHTTHNLQKIVSFNLADIGEGIREVTIKEWFVKVGDKVEQFDEICEVQSDKASVTITSRYDGKVTKLYKGVDEIASVGKPLLDFDVEDENDTSSSSSDSSGSDVEPSAEKDVPLSNVLTGKVLATPAVRRIAMQNKLDLSKVKATGKAGRVMKEDILKHINQTADESLKVSAPIPQATPALPMASRIPTKPLQDTIIPIKGVTKIMFKTMTAALQIPHFSCSEEIDITKLVEVRNSVKDLAAIKGVKMTFMPFFIKAASRALEKFPILNSSLDDKNENIIFKSTHNITIAMDTPSGLVVPNVKNVQNKTLLEIAADLNYLQEAGMKGTLKPDDLSGGTFSLSNIGNMGGTYTHPVVLSPQVAIGAIGRAQVLPRFGPNGEVVKAHILTVSWSADHRIIDGATMVNFCQIWKQYLENPNLLMLDI